MNQKVLKLGATAVSAAMLLSGCFPSALLPDRPSYTTPTQVTMTTPPAVTGGNDSDSFGGGTSISHEWSEDRGTQLNFSNRQLEIERIGREEDVAMSSDGLWTVFVYMCGTDLESDGGAATEDLMEMESATESCSKLRFVVEAGGTYRWNNNMLEGMKSQRLIISGGHTEVLDSGNAKNMGSAGTLADFISWGVENYASQYMVLDLWDHGGGSISGVCFDELHNDDSLTVKEIDTALASVFGEMTDRFELIGFDACLMAAVEMANVLVPYGRYMLGSQDLESGFGWNYGSLASAVNGGAVSGAEVGRYICDDYYNECSHYGWQDEITMSVIDLSGMDAFIEAFNDHAAEVYRYASDGGTTDVIKAAKKALNFGGNNRTEGYTNMVDLMDLIRLTSAYSSSASTAAQRLEDCVVYMVNGSYRAGAGGLNVYYPLSVQGSSELDVFRNICVSPYYLSIVDLCAYGSDNNGNIGGFNFDWWLGDGSGFWSSFFDWGSGSYDYWNNEHDDNLNFDYSSSAITFIDEPQVNGDGCYYFRLTEDSLNNLDTVYCNVMISYWDNVDNCEYMLDLGTDDYVDLDWYTGECYDSFDGYWFALPDGQPLCVYLTDTFYDPDTDEYYNLYSAPIYINDEFTYLRIKQSYYDYGIETEILGIWDGISESGSASRDLYQLQVGDRISPCYPAYDAYTGEYVMDFYGFDYIYYGDSEIVEDILYEGDYYYAFEIYDLYDNAFYTDFVLFGVDEDGTLYYYE